MRTWVCRLVFPRIGRPLFRSLEIRLYLRRSLNLHLRRIKAQPVLVPVRLNPVVLLRVLLRGVVPRGIAIGPLLTLLLVIGGLAAGINKGVTVYNLKCVCICAHFFPSQISLHLLKSSVCKFPFRWRHFMRDR